MNQKKVMLIFNVKFKTNNGGENDDMLKIINLLLCRWITMHWASFISFSFSVGVLAIITRRAKLH